MNILKYLFPTLTGMALLQGCSQIPDESPTSPQRGGMFTVQLETESLATAKNSVANGNSDNTSIRQVIGYRFSEGILREIVPGIESDAEGTYTFPLKELSGVLRFVANDETGIFSQVEPESTSLEAFLLHSTTIDRMAGDRFLMTGSTEIKTQNTTVPSIRMRRSVARIDLFNPDRGVTVHHITIRGIADKGYVNEQPNSETLEPTDKSDFTIDYTDAPLGNGRETLLYLCEQGNEGLSAEAIVEFEGGLHRMVATFPAQILRNRIYTLQVHGKGADVSLSIVAEGWETNHTTEALPDSKGIIDIDSSILPGNVRVNESLVTGESDEITKSPGDALLSGSYVVSGECRAVLEHVGLSSYASKIALEAKASRKKQQTEMMRSLDKLVKVIGIAIIPIGLLMFCSTFFFLKNSFQQSVVSVIAALVGMIPEGLYLLASVALVVSVMRLGRKKVLVHEMACVETLARVNVLCVDKTGTITEEKMSVSEVVPLENYNTGNYPSLHEMIGNLVNNLPADNITVETLNEMGKLKTRVGTTILSAAIIDDIIGIVAYLGVDHLIDLFGYDILDGRTLGGH